MKKIIAIIVFLCISLFSFSQENIVVFPDTEYEYDWQIGSYENLGVLVGVVISDEPNKLGNYRYDIYMTSNTSENELIVPVVVGDINIINGWEEKTNTLTMIITDDVLLIYTIFLPTNNAEVIISWEYIQKIN